MELADLRTGGKRALARTLARLETAPEDPELTALLDKALAAPHGFSLGLTGPPGVGKSSLIDAMIRVLRGRGQTVGVIAVDPSSRRSGGALLGDRTRLHTDPEDQGIFVRSMAARDRLGGLAEITYPAMVLMRACFDCVIVETVGVGQSETAIADIADIVAFCAQPGSGDALQFMKAGVMEIPDLVIVTKADMTALAARAVSDLRGALGLASGGRPPDVLACSAARAEGIETLLEHIQTLAAAKTPHHTDQAGRWINQQILARFGTVGLGAVQASALEHMKNQPFTSMASLSARLTAHMGTAMMGANVPAMDT